MYFFSDNALLHSTFFPVFTSYVLGPTKEKSLESMFLGVWLSNVYCHRKARKDALESDAIETRCTIYEQLGQALDFV